MTKYARLEIQQIINGLDIEIKTEWEELEGQGYKAWELKSSLYQYPIEAETEFECLHNLIKEMKDEIIKLRLRCADLEASYKNAIEALDPNLALRKIAES